MDQTQIDTGFRLVAGAEQAEGVQQLNLAASELNQPLERFFAYYPATLPADAPATPGSFLTVEPASIALGTLKKAELRDALVIRLQETAGQPTQAQIRLEGLPAHQADFGPYEIRSFVVEQDGSWHAVNLLEEPQHHR